MASTSGRSGGAGRGRGGGARKRSAAEANGDTEPGAKRGANGRAKRMTKKALAAQAQVGPIYFWMSRLICSEQALHAMLPCLQGSAANFGECGVHASVRGQLLSRSA